jgi:uncharacterized repeat protein (TIGR03803 family)
MIVTIESRHLVCGTLRRTASLALPLAVALALGMVWTQSADARTHKETVLHSFTGLGNDGMNPIGPAVLLQDGTGNLYGTTLHGGAYNYGTVLKLSPTGKQTVLHSFQKNQMDNGDGNPPNESLVMDSIGNLYGTTLQGGTSGLGIVFELQPAGRGYKEIVLHVFAGGTNDGATPTTGLIRDSEGNLYGATNNGGADDSGILFKLDPTDQLTVIHSFGAGEGSNVAGLARDSKGNFYATSVAGGASGCGVVAKIDPSGSETILHAFTGVQGDGCTPMGPVLLDAVGSIYGTTLLGGSGSCQPPISSIPGCGTVFKLDTSGTYSVIYNFPGTGGQGAGPIGGLTADGAGNLYGVTEDGGIGTCAAYPSKSGGYFTGYPGCGIIFKLSAAGKETVLHKFTGRYDGGNPESGLVLDSSGNLFGTTYDGGDVKGCGFVKGGGCGVVFKIPK